jgi:hypothetical protein
MTLLGEDLSLDGSDRSIPGSVLSTWFISLQRIKDDSANGPLASDLLSVMSFLDSQEIPKSLLELLSEKSLRAHYLKAFGSLKAMSLISESEHKTFSMHRLVQLSMRRWLKQEGTDQEIASKVISMLAEAFPDGSFKTWKDCSALIVHAEAVLRLASISTDRTTQARLLFNVAAFQTGRGQYGAAEAKLREVVELEKELLGADSLETLQATDSLEKLLGKKHIETLKTAQILATLLGNRGNHKLAEEQNRQIWEARSKILGPKHLETLESAANLVLSLWELGNYNEAEKLARGVLDAREKALGAENPNVLDIAGTLGFILE